MYRYVLAAALIVGCTLPAFAEKKGFYIVRGPDKKCMVVETPPTDITVRIGKDVYTTQEEAEADVAVVCK
jgi:hypothetical protein